jgi:hypothetical protein
VALVALSLTVHEEFVTVGTVYDPRTVWLPLFEVESESVRPLAAVNARRPTVAEVAESLTVQLVIVGTVYDPITVCWPLLLVLRLNVRPLLFVKARRPTVADVALSETVQDEFVTLGTV